MKFNTGAEAAADVHHHVTLSIVGTDLMPDNGYFRASCPRETDKDLRGASAAIGDINRMASLEVRRISDIASNAGALQPSSTALAAAGRSGGSRAVWCAAKLPDCSAPRILPWMAATWSGGRPYSLAVGPPRSTPFFTPALTTRGGAQATLTLCLLFRGTMAHAETADLQVGGKSPGSGRQGCKSRR
jgi:hypothetical protein